MTINCENCGKEIASVENAYCMAIVLQKVSTTGYSFYQCNQGSSVDGHNYQHWLCSINHMKQEAINCINNHYQENSLISVSNQQVNLHSFILQAKLSCKICQLSLNNLAYRFCLTQAEPQTTRLDGSDNDLSEWCCSLVHAQQSALSIVQS